MTERYVAFVSYSQQDRKWADWLLSRIESYRVPRNLVGESRGGRTIPDRLRPLFKDREELPSGSDLSALVDSAIQDAGALIVICSPASQASDWVNSEIRLYKSHHGNARIFPLLVAEDEQSAFPRALTEQLDGNGLVIGNDPVPLAADVNKLKDGRQNAKLKIIAGLLNVSFDELKQRELHSQYRRMSYIAAASLVIVTLMIGLTVRAVLSEQEAQLRRTQAEGIIEFMIGDLRRQLEPIGRLDVLNDVGREAQGYFATLDASTQSAESLSRRGKVSQQIGEIALLQGNIEQSLPLFRDALQIQTTAFAENPTPEMRFDLSQANFWLGYGYWEIGDYAQALVYLNTYREHSKQLVEIDPTNVTWQLELAFADVNLGTIRFEQQAYTEALTHFETTTHQLERLTVTYPDQADFPVALAQSLAWLGGTYWELGRIVKAEDAFSRQASLLKARFDADAENYTLRENYTLALQRYALALMENGAFTAAKTALDEALRHTGELIQREADNFFWRYAHARSHWFLGQLFLSQSEWAEALTHLLEAEREFPVTEDHNRRDKWQMEQVALSNDIAETLLRQGDRDRARDWNYQSQQLIADRFGDESQDDSQQLRVRGEALLLASCLAEPEPVLQELRDIAARMAALNHILEPEYLRIRARLQARLGVADAQSTESAVGAFLAACQQVTAKR